MIFFNNINHGYRAAIMEKSSFWLLLSYMTAATYCYYDNVRRTMCTTIASYLLQKFVQCNFYLKNFILKIKVNLIQFSKILSFWLSFKPLWWIFAKLAWGKNGILNLRKMTIFLPFCHIFSSHKKSVVLVVVGLKKWMKQNAKNAEANIFIVFIWQFHAWS